MIKKFDEYVNEDLRSKNITLPEIKIDNLKILYHNIKVNYNNDFKIVISYDEILSLNKEFYKILENDNIKIEDIIFENCRKISLYDINNFKKISDYGKFGEGIKDFDCMNCGNLQSLEGAPKEVGGYFDCSYCNNLQSLKDCPGTVNGDFDCSHCNNLQSLNGCPKEVKDNFNCYGCDKLQSLEGAPEKVNGNFGCSHCDNLQSLEGCPKNVGGNFSCYGCINLQSLNGSPETVNDFNCSYCDNLQSLEGCPETVIGFYCKSCNLDFIELAKQKYGNKCFY